MDQASRHHQEALDCRARARQLRSLAQRAPTKPMADHLFAYARYLADRADGIEASLVMASATRSDA
jgi:hypothetical protein